MVTFNRTVLPSYYGLLRLCCEHSRTFTRQLSTHSNMKWAFENLTPRMNQYPQVGPTSEKMLTEHTGYGAVSLCVLCVCCYALLFVFFLLFSFSFFCLFVSGSAWLQMCLCLGLCLYLCAFTYVNVLLEYTKLLLILMFVLPSGCGRVVFSHASVCGVCCN